jgi:GT2 family glycosyltransferase
MKISIVTAICGALDVTQRWFDETIRNCMTDPEIILVSNGNTPEEVMRLDQMRGSRQGDLLDFPDPMGSTKAFNAGLRESKGDVVVMIHNDLLMKESGWDARLLSAFENDPGTTIGVVGIHGAAQLGRPELYREPYQLIQLARALTFSNLVDAESHGARLTIPREAVTLDGMFLAARRADLMAWGGFDERYRHHQYDHHLCLIARQAGRRNLFVPLVGHHLSGQTANFSRYNDDLKAKGIDGDSEVHRKSHELFYEYWRGTGQLPARCD